MSTAVQDLAEPAEVEINTEPTIHEGEQALEHKKHGRTVECEGWTEGPRRAADG